MEILNISKKIKKPNKRTFLDHKQATKSANLTPFSLSKHPQFEISYIFFACQTKPSRD
ncbi:hypothetical protein Hanom_Chr07g00635461 [Helianthus anomalus]